MEGRATRIERREKGVDCVASSKRATARASVELDFIKMSLGFSFSCYYQRSKRRWMPGTGGANAKGGGGIFLTNGLLLSALPAKFILFARLLLLLQSKRDREGRKSQLCLWCHGASDSIYLQPPVTQLLLLLLVQEEEEEKGGRCNVSYL